jgi:hypothetical protein
MQSKKNAIEPPRRQDRQERRGEEGENKFKESNIQLY